MHIIPLDDTGDRHLMDRAALAQWLTLSEVTIRRRCRPSYKDPKTGRLFYKAEECADQLDRVFPRGKMCEDGIKRRRRV